MPQYDAAQAGAVGSLVLTALAVMGSPGPSTTSLVASVIAYGMGRSLAYAAGLVVGALVVLVAIATGITAALLAVPAVHTALLIVAMGYILWLAYRLATAPLPVDQNVAAPPITTERTVAEQTPAEKTPAEKTDAGNMDAEKTATTPPPAEQTTAAAPPTEKTAAEQTAAEKTAADRTPAERTVAEQTAAGRTAAGRTAAAGRRRSFVDGAVLGFVNPKAWIAISAVFASAQLASAAIANAVLKIAVLTCMVALIHAIWLLAGRLLMPFLRDPRRARAVNIALAGVLVVTSVVGLLS